MLARHLVVSKRDGKEEGEAIKRLPKQAPSPNPLVGFCFQSSVMRLAGDRQEASWQGGSEATERLTGDLDAWNWWITGYRTVEK